MDLIWELIFSKSTIEKARPQGTGLSRDATLIIGLIPQCRRDLANISTGGGVCVCLAPVPRTANGVQPSQPNAGSPGDRNIPSPATGRPAAPGSIRGSALGAGSHLTRLSGPRLKPTTPLPSLYLFDCYELSIGSRIGKCQVWVCKVQHLDRPAQPDIFPYTVASPKPPSLAGWASWSPGQGGVV